MAPYTHSLLHNYLMSFMHIVLLPCVCVALFINNLQKERKKKSGKWKAIGNVYASISLRDLNAFIAVDEDATNKTLIEH